MANQGRRFSKAWDRAKGVKPVITEEDIKENDKQGYQQEQENNNTIGEEGDFITFRDSEEGSFNYFGGSKLDKLGKSAWGLGKQTKLQARPFLSNG